ncbi:MAG: N-acetylmuramoyl-L-alanine amidase [Bacteroidales bacterium]|nr:N-acetylmuramoyl-L-alanine amidase [Bacteroidales bacterium]
MKRLIFVFVLWLAVFLWNTKVYSQDPYKIKVVVIDAGHGGNDPGAVGKSSKEKDIALSVALKLGNYIKTNYKDVKVIYTRDTDVFVELYKRAEIANKANADLFISIHCNATESSKPNGTETWVMGLHKSQANLEVAKKENSAILLESNSGDAYDNFNPNSPESYIIFSLFQSAFRDQSIDFATKIENEFKTRVGRNDRGVKEAGFLVLWKTTMPSVLIELGFVSNPEEEKFLKSTQGQDYLASAIYRAFKQYKTEMEGSDGKAEQSDLKSVDVENKKEDAKQESVQAKQADADTIKTAALVEDEIVFGVQFTSSSEKKPASASSFQSLQDVWSYYQSGLYKYVSGKYDTIDDAVSHLKIVRSKGFSDAFVVAFVNGKRITPQEAVKLIEEKKKNNP